MKREPKRLAQVHDIIRMKHYSIRTGRAYIDWSQRFTFFHHKDYPKLRHKNVSTTRLDIHVLQEGGQGA